MVNHLTPQDVACPNQDCGDYDKPGANNIIKFGKTRQTVQRFQCKTCGTTFTATHGTVFYRRRTSHQSIMETLVLLAEGVSINNVAVAKRIKPDTIRDWLHEATQHRKAVEDSLRTEYHLKQNQIEHLWIYLQNQNENGHRDGNGTQHAGNNRP